MWANRQVGSGIGRWHIVRVGEVWGRCKERAAHMYCVGGSS